MVITPAISSYCKLLIIFSITAILGMIVFLSPPDMDIFAPYHPIACKYYPLAFLHSLNEPCNSTFDLRIAGFIPWTRAHDHQGISEALFYFPIYLLFPYWWSVYILNIIWLIAIVWFFIKITGVNPWIAALVFICNFYTAYNILEDYHPGAQTVLIFLIPWLSKCILSVPAWGKKWWALNAILGIAAFMGMEEKFNFIYYLPTALILAVYCNINTLPLPALLRALWLKCLPASAIFAGLVLLLLSAQMHDGYSYVKSLPYLSHRYSHYHEIFPYLTHLKEMVMAYVLNFSNSAGNVYVGAWKKVLMSQPPDYKGIAFTLLFWLVAAWPVFIFYRHTPGLSSIKEYRQCRLLSQGFLMAGVTYLLLISAQTGARLGSHLFPLVVCLLGCITLCTDYMYRNRLFSRLPWFAIGLSVCQIFCTAHVVIQRPHDAFSWDRFGAIAYTQRPEIADNAVIANMVWGTYYISALYGPQDQLVSYIYGEPKPAQLERLIKISRSQNRYIVFICPKDMRIQLQERLPTLHKLYPDNNKPSFWEVWGEDPDVIKHPVGSVM